jgi:hypothetical protein
LAKSTVKLRNAGMAGGVAAAVDSLPLRTVALAGVLG